MGTWTYLVTWQAAAGVVGNGVTSRDRSIDSFAEVTAIEHALRHATGLTGLVLTNFVLLKRRRFTRWQREETTVVDRRGPVVAWPR